MPDPARVRAVVFDLDGTLVDSLRDLAESGNAMLARFGHRPLAVDRYRGLVGNAARHLVREALRLASGGTEALDGDDPATSARLEERLSVFLEAYARRPLVHTRPYAGIEAMLEVLGGRVPLAVVTNKPHDRAREVVAKLFGERFAAVRGFHDGVPRKPDPASTLEALAVMGVTPGEAVFVGDMDVDIRTAQAAGCASVGVLWGFPRGAGLQEAGASMLIDRPEALSAWLVGGTGAV